MRQLLSVSLPEDLASTVNRLVKKSHMTRSEIVKLALRDFVHRFEFEELRRLLIPRARAKGIFTDEDVFRKIRS